MTHCHLSCTVQHLKRVLEEAVYVDVTSVREFVAVLRNAISGAISNLNSFAAVCCVIGNRNWVRFCSKLDK